MESESRGFLLNDNLNNRDLALAFAVRDNIDAEGADVRVEITWTGSGQELESNRSGQFNVVVIGTNYSVNVSSIAEKSTDVPILNSARGV